MRGGEATAGGIRLLGETAWDGSPWVGEAGWIRVRWDGGG